MTVTQTADSMARKRAVLFVVLACVLLLSGLLGVGQPATGRQVAFWLVMAALVAANLTPLATMFRRGHLFRLLNDETTRDHRRTSFIAGFWAAIISAGSVYGASTFVSVNAGDGARLIITMALAAGLVAFAALEWRAIRA